MTERRYAVSLVDAANRSAFVDRVMELTWEQLCEALSDHEVVEGEKAEQPAFSPTVFEDFRRDIDHAEAISLFVGDLDNLTDEQVNTLVQVVEKQGWAAHLYTTWRHHTSEDTHRLRMVVPLDKPVPAEQWRTFWHACNKIFRGLCDTSCEDEARLYFNAVVLPEGLDQAVSFSVEGGVVDTEAILKDAPKILPSKKSSRVKLKATERTFEVSRDDLKVYARLLGKKRGSHSRRMGALLKAVVDGDSFAKPGDRDNVLWKLACLIGERWPLADPEKAARHFAASLQVMAAVEPFGEESLDDTQDRVSDKIRRAQDKELERQQAALEAEEIEIRRKIREAFRSPREEPYTEEELDAQDLNRNRWVILHEKAYYFWVDGGYVGPFGKEAGLLAAQIYLAPAESVGVSLYRFNARGQRVQKELRQLVDQYGKVAEKTVVDLTSQRSYFNEKRLAIVEAPTPLRTDIKAEFSEAVDTWFRLLGGRKYHLLVAWLSQLGNLSKPCTALFLTGKKGVGKSLFATGCARVYGQNPTPLEGVMAANFNEGLLQNPVVVADEYLPKDSRGRPQHAELRMFTQLRERALNRKYMPVAHLIGAARILILSNNSEILGTEDMNVNSMDIEAIVDRYLHIEVLSDEAEKYLKMIDTNKWVEGDVLASHILWLIENHAWVPNGRFLVHDESDELKGKLIASTGARGAVLQWIAGYLSDPIEMDNDPQWGFYVRVEEGDLYVTTKGIIACWDKYVSNYRVPTTHTLGRALAALCDEKRYRKKLPRTLKKGEKARPAYRRVKIEHVIQWGKDHDMISEAEIKEALVQNTLEAMIPRMN